MGSRLRPDTTYIRGHTLAIQDAVAAANILAYRLRHGSLTIGDLRRVERRRTLPTCLTQRLQILIQNRVLGRVLGSHERITVPWVLRVLQRRPILRRIPSRLIGVGLALRTSGQSRSGVGRSAD